jgi:hypothetical protein
MILDHLWTILEVDTSKADAAIVQNRKSVDELVDGLGEAEQQGTKTGSTLTAVALKIGAAFLAAGGVLQTINGATALAERVADLGDLSDNLDISVEKLDAFQKAMYATGGTAEGALSTIESLTRRMGKGFRDADGPIAKTLGGLGIKLTDASGRAKDSIDVITDLAGALEGVNKAQAYQTLQQLGISDPKVIENILKGRKEMEGLLRVEKERGVISQAEVERARKLADAQDRLRASVSRISDGFLNMFIPAVTKVIEWLDQLTSWASEHSDAITGFFIAIGAVVAAVYLPAMIAAAAATLAATWPIIAMVAVVGAVAAAFAIAYEDIMAFINGNESLTGEIFEKYPLIKDMVYGIIDAFKLMGQTITAVFTGLWETLKTFAGYLTDIWNAAGKFFKGFNGALVGDVTMAQNVQTAAATAPANSVTSTAISNQSNNKQENRVQVGQVVVNTQATDARGVAGSVATELNDQLLNVQAENSSVVTR